MTQAVKEAIQERIAESKDQLTKYGNDREFDVFLKGMIRAFYETLAAEPALEISDIEEAE